MKDFILYIKVGWKAFEGERWVFFFLLPFATVMYLISKVRKDGKS